MLADNRALAVRIKELRTERGLKQSEVAARLGVSQPAYHGLENRGEGLDLAYLIALARVYGLPLSEAFPDYVPTADERLIIAHTWAANPDGHTLADLSAA